MTEPCRSRTSRVIVLLGFAVLPLMVAGGWLWDLHDTGQASGLGALRGIAFLGVLGLLLLPAWRGWILDLGDLLLERLGWVSWLLLGVLGGGWAHLPGSGRLWAGLGLLALILGIESWRREIRRDRRKTLAKALAVLSTACALGLGELALRRWILPRRSHARIFSRHDPVLGWRLRPSFSVRRVADTYTAIESTNSLGFRTIEVPFRKPAGVRRVVILGDSQSEGYTVDDQETYAALLQEGLSRARPTQVICLGVGGYSTDQELLSYLLVGRRYAPDLVLLQLDPNDVAFNTRSGYWRGGKPVFRRFGETLVLTGVPVPNRLESGLTPPWARGSALAFLLEHGLTQLAVRREEHPPVSMDEAWLVTELLLENLAAQVHRDGALLLLVNASTANREADLRFQEIARGLDLPFIDLHPLYAEDYWAFRTEGDSHWNERGHQVVAEHLTGHLGALLEESSVPPQPGLAP